MDILRQVNEEEKITMLIVTHAREVAEQTHQIINFKDGLISSIENMRQ